MLIDHMLRHQPAIIREKMLEDDFFIGKYGLKTIRVANLGNRISINLDNMLDGVKNCISTKTGKEVEDVNKKTVVIKHGENDKIYASYKKEPEISIPIDDLFLIVSPEKKERRNALELCLKKLGPTFPNYQNYISISESREFTEDEIECVIDELTEGCSAFEARLNAALNSGATHIDDLAPSKIDYYHKFCGPKPINQNVDEYIEHVLLDYRAKLIDRNLHEGLRIGSIGALRHDLLPSKLLLSIDDDQIWNAMQYCAPELDPFSLLSALDISALRSKDSRFCDFTRTAMEKLMEESFILQNGMDAYEFQPILARLIFDRICLMADGAAHPGYWRRTAAWMQAGIIMRACSKYGVELESLKQWIESQRNSMSELRKVMDLYEEPNYHCHRMEKEIFSSEIFGRLLMIRDSLKKKDIELPLSEKLEKKIESHKSSHTDIAPFLPGPLDSNQFLNRSKERRVGKQELQLMIDELEKDPIGEIWYNIGFLSQYFNFCDLPEDIVNNVISRIKFSDDTETRIHELSRIHQACILGLAQELSYLPECIAEKVLDNARSIASSKEMIISVYIILMLGAILPAEINSNNWLSDKLTRLSRLIPKGEISKELALQLNQLSFILPLGTNFYMQAKAIAETGS